MMERGRRVQKDQTCEKQRQIAMGHRARMDLRTRRQRRIGCLKYASVEPAENRRGKPVAAVNNAGM
jgi:hypothetical protein